MDRAGPGKGKRLAAGVLGLLALCLVLLSVFFLTAEAAHDCAGEDCPVCACVRQCQATLRGLGGGAPLPSAVAPVVPLLLAACLSVAAGPLETLVSRKIRLNN